MNTFSCSLVALSQTGSALARTNLSSFAPCTLGCNRHSLAICISIGIVRSRENEFGGLFDYKVYMFLTVQSSNSIHCSQAQSLEAEDNSDQR